ncbi:MAG: hypothetical protein DELT_01734 [Desulfovibrio sp.]
MPDFTPRILPRAEIAALKETLVNPEIPNRERLDTFLQCKTVCGDHGDAALDELELPHPVREAVTLASTDPAQATFAAELLGAMVTGDIHEKKTAAKLTCLAGTNPSAQALLDTLMEKHEPLDDTGAYQVAGAVSVPGEKAETPAELAWQEKALLGAMGVMRGQTELDLPKAATHGTIKAINATADLMYDGMDWLRDNGWFDANHKRLSIPNLPDPKTPAGQMASGISQFLVGFKGFDKALKAVKAASYGTSMVKTAATGALADFTVFDGQEERVSNLLLQFPALANPVTEFMAAKPDDTKAMGRLKNSLEGLGVGMVAEALGHGLRMVKVWRQAKAEIEAFPPPDEAGKKAALKEREPVVTLTGDEFSPYKGTTKEKATAWYVEHLAGKKGKHPTFGEYKFTTDVGKPLSNSADERKLKLFPKLREIIDSSEEVASIASAKAKHQGKNINYHYMRTTVKLGDELLDVGLTMRQAPNGKFYYDHLLYDVDIKKSAPWVSPAEVNPLSPMGTKGPKGTRGDHPALTRGAIEKINSNDDNVNLVILGVRSLRGVAQAEENK